MPFCLPGKTFSLLFTLIFLTSCYSPKSEIEEDKHPEIPEFPAFDSPDVKVEKVAELNIPKESEYRLTVRKNYLFVYVKGPQDNSDGYDDEQVFLCLRDGKLMGKASWKDYPRDGGSFFTSEGNLYLGNYCFLAPEYDKRIEVPVYSMWEVRNDYHDTHPNRSSQMDKEIREIQLQLQREVFGRIKTIYQPIHYNGDEKVFNPFNESIYLCNAKTKAPFYIYSDLFDDLSLTAKGKKRHSLNRDYVDQIRPMVSFLETQRFFGELDLDSTYSDMDFFKETGSVVVGNEWYSYGNHVAGSCGYMPVYMYYYDVDYKGKIVKTKESKLKRNTGVPVKINSAWYFLTTNRAGSKLTVYYLK